MSIATEIVRSWRDPRGTLRRLLPQATEGRALAYLMGACVLLFVAQWPRLAREAELSPGIPLDARLAGALQGIVFILPLLLYAVAGVSHVVARLVGGRGTWFGARVALFWSFLAAAPLFLFHGLVAGLIGPGLEQALSGTLLGGGFLLHWILALVEVERPSLEAGQGRA